MKHEINTKIEINNSIWKGETDGICHCPIPELMDFYGYNEKGIYKLKGFICKRCAGKINPHLKPPLRHQSPLSI